jgi:hypothetical protein
MARCRVIHELPGGPGFRAGRELRDPLTLCAAKSVLCCFQWKRSSHSWSSEGSAPALTLCPFPASGRPVRTVLGAPNRRASGVLFLQPCIRPLREPHRSLTVVPLIADKRYYGEVPMRLRWGHGGIGRRSRRTGASQRKQRATQNGIQRQWLIWSWFGMQSSWSNRGYGLAEAVITVESPGLSCSQISLWV